MKRIIARYWPLLGIVLLSGVVIFYMARSARETESVRRPIVQEAELEEGITLSDIHYTQDDPEQGMQWVLDAEEVRFSQDRTYFSFRDFRIKLFPEGRPPLELEGRRGDYDKSRARVNLRGDLKGLSRNGYRISADHLLYNHEDGVLSTDGSVRITGPFFTVTGQGLHFDLEEERLRINSGVTTLVEEDVLT